MATEVAHGGVRDANTGEYLAGEPSDEMKKADGPVLARCDDGEHWELVSLDDDPVKELAVKQDGGVRSVVVEGAKRPSHSTAKES